jgi:hypothetical protein
MVLHFGYSKRHSRVKDEEIQWILFPQYVKERAHIFELQTLNEVKDKAIPVRV